MQTASYVALSRQTVLTRTIDVLANNIANASTPAFKGSMPLFREIIANGPNNEHTSYVADGGVVRDLKPGVLTATSNPLDVGIDGNGYFRVSTPDGERYTRNGHFQINQASQLVTSQGYPILDDRDQPITLSRNARSIDISKTGAIRTEAGPVAKLGVVRFDNQQLLNSAADGLYVTDQQPNPDTTSEINQGTIEDSNVQPIVEMTKLMDLQRSYTNAQDLVEGEDNRIRNAIDKLSRVA